MQNNRSWTRWLEILAMVAGAVLALSPIWVSVGATGITTMIVLGSLIFLSGLAATIAPGAFTGNWGDVILGVLTFIAPWVIGYSNDPGATWTSWVVGAVAFVIGVIALAPSARMTTAGGNRLAHGSR